MVYLAFLIPILTIVILAIFFHKRIVWWELVLPLAFSALVIFIGKHIAINSLLMDTEYYGGYVKEVRYYEDWNERVHCRHPRYCTSCSGSGKTRSCHTYICGYYHAYDVDYHPEYWTAETTLGTYGITKTRYEKLINQFRTTPQFKDMKRHYHTNDGDMYYGSWFGQNETLEPVVKTHHYKNKTKAALNVFHFDPVDTSDIKQYGLFAYPEIYNTFNQKCLLGLENKKADQNLQVVNSLYGASRELRAYFLVFKNQPRDAGYYQERYWEGSNKNEFVTCVGIDDHNRVTWAYIFSWTEREDLKVQIRTYLENQKILDVEKATQYVSDQLLQRWERRSFKEFDYLTVNPTTSQSIWIMIITALFCGGLGYFAVVNEIDPD